MSVTNFMQCGVDSADPFVAVTPADETVNPYPAKPGKRLWMEVRRASDNPESSTPIKSKRMFRDRGIDMTIFPEKLAAAER